MSIAVPEAVAVGDTVTLSCHYDLENVRIISSLIIWIYINKYLIYFQLQAALYSVRWYFELEEFYRYVPKESPPTRVFANTGITVDVSIQFFF